MFKAIFIFITLIHGAIHLMGFAKAFNLAEIKELTCAISKPAGLLWLLCTVMFIITASLFYAGYKHWWVIAAAGIFISQFLIISCFKDASFGTIPNIIILFTAVTAYGVYSFNNYSQAWLNTILKSASAEKIKVSEQIVKNLPPSLKKWFKRSNVIGKEISTVVFLTQRGELRTSPDGKWMPVTASQWLTSQNPSFLWKARIEAAPLIHISGCDKYYDGHGHMLIKLMSIFKIADSSGKEIDQGTLLRYLGESVWSPASLLNEYITFEQAGQRSVNATMNYGGIKASGVYEFDENGDFVSFTAKRYYERKSGATLEDWLVTANPAGYREFGGIRAPAKLSVTWKLKEGDFTWYRLEVDKIDYYSMPGEYIKN